MRLAPLSPVLALAILLVPLSGPGLGGHVAGQEPELEVRVWIDRGDEPVLERGDRARIYYRVSDDAYVAIFHVDTNGTVQLLSPGTPGEVDWVRGGRDYRLLFPRSTYWFVEDDPGMGYFFAIASPEPLDFSRFRYSPYEGGWDLYQVGRQVYRDPYAAMDDYVVALIPDWEYVPYALDFTSYHVGREYEYPRFLCYDCHGFRPWSSWNPYLSACVDFRVVVYDDPYYYPAYRYRGDRVVFVRPPAPGLPRFAFKERARGESSAPLVRERDLDGRALPPVQRRVTPGSGDPEAPVRRTPEAAPGVGVPSRRPSEVRPPGRGEGAVPGSRPSSTREMPSLERRPSEPSSRGSSPPPARSTPSTRSSNPPPARSTPSSRGSNPPPARSTPSSRGSNPPPARSTPSTRNSNPPPARSAPSTRSSSPPPARSAPPTRSSSPPPARSTPPPRSSSPPPARSTPSSRNSNPPPARSTPPPRSGSPPATPPRRRPPPPDPA